MDYAAELYASVFRDLVKELAELNKGNSEDTLELEIKYIRKRLEEKNLGFLFESDDNKRRYYKYLKAQAANAFKSQRNQGRFCKTTEADFSSIREKCKRNEDGKDIVWTLQASGAKYTNQKLMQVNDKKSYDQFADFLKQVGFSDEEKKLFMYPGKNDNSGRQGNSNYFWFNGLVDNGNVIYDKEYQGDDAQFLNALEKSNLQKMHENLRELLKLYDKIQKEKSTREVVIQNVIWMAENLSNLIPVIDENSLLKRKEQLQKEKIAVRHAVFKKFLILRDNDGKLDGDHLNNVLVGYFEDYALIETLVNEVVVTGKFNDEQILVIVEEYLNLLRDDMEWLKGRVKEYIALMSKREPYSIQTYRDMWEETYKDNTEDE